MHGFRALSFLNRKRRSSLAFPLAHERKASRGLSQVRNHFMAIFNVKFNCAAFVAAARAFA